MQNRVKEKRILQRFLKEAELDFSVQDDQILIPLAFGDTQVDMMASWSKDIICIEIRLLELDEDEQDQLDPVLARSLLIANYDMDIGKFCVAPYGLSLLVDLDARNLQNQELESGITSLLNGFELYLEILQSWFKYLDEAGEVEFEEDEEYQDYYDAPQDEWAAPDTRKGLVFRSLIGVAKVGLTAVALGGIAATLGVPAAGIAGVVAATVPGTRH